MGKTSKDKDFLRHKVIGSSQIKEIAFDKYSKALYIKFHNDSTYSYTPFTEEQYNEFINADSIGKYFHANIKSLNTVKL